MRALAMTMIRIVTVRAMEKNNALPIHNSGTVFTNDFPLVLIGCPLIGFPLVSRRHLSEHFPRRFRGEGYAFATETRFRLARFHFA